MTSYKTSASLCAGEIPQFPRSIEITEPNKRINRRLFIHDGTIQEVACDAMVLSVNQQLMPKGMIGVHESAGPELKAEVKKHAPKQVD